MAILARGVCIEAAENHAQVSNIAHLTSYRGAYMISVSLQEEIRKATPSLAQSIV